MPGVLYRPPLWRTGHALRLRTTSSVFVMRIPLAAPPAKLSLQLPLSDSQILFFCLLLTLTAMLSEQPPPLIMEMASLFLGD